MIGMLCCVNLALGDKLQLTDSTSQSNGVRVYRVRFFAELDSLREVKDWSPGQGSVPITRDQAVKMAKQAALESGQNQFAEEEIQVELRKALPFDSDTGQEIKVPAGLCLWYYEIRFTNSYDPEATYLVTMDGRLATREINR